MVFKINCRCYSIIEENSNSFNLLFSISLAMFLLSTRFNYNYSLGKKKINTILKEKCMYNNYIGNIF